MANNQSNTYFPSTFQDYLKTNQLPIVNTAAAISVDSIEKLNPRLRSENTMVFRLGSSENGTGTQFALRKVENLSEYFLIDEEVFTDKKGNIFPFSESNEFLAYIVLPSLSETSLVNLGLASGLIGHALGLTMPKITIAPASFNTLVR